MTDRKETSAKTICLVIPSLGPGGMERVMSELANYFSNESNVIVHIILYGMKRDIFYAIKNNITIHTPKFQFNNDYRTIFAMRTMFFLRKKVKEINPSTILSFGEYWNNMVLLSLMGLRYPIYISDRSQPDKNLGRFQNILRNKLYPKASGYIAQTGRAQVIAVKNRWNTNITVIGNPINQALLHKSLEKSNIILTIGRLIPTKHIDELIEIYQIINDMTWRLVIVGGNAKNLQLLERYKEFVHKLGLEDRIDLVGPSTNVAEYYKNAKIFAFTSSSEGFPNVIGEAMSYGLPVIAYDCKAGPSDLIVDGKTGFLIPERDQKNYVKKLKKLMNERELRNRFRENAIEKIKDFDTETISNKFFKFITK